MAALTSNDILNRALVLIGDNQAPVQGTWPAFDNSAAGQAGNIIYQDCVQAVAREYGYDFSRTPVVLQLSGNFPPTGWLYDYLYPPLALQIRELFPVTGTYDINDPLPNNFTVASEPVNNVPTKVIYANLVNAEAYITGQPPENLWDALFVEAVVRRVAAALSMGTAGRPDFARAMLESAAGTAQLGQRRDG